ncbi:unnamed protein product, partial [Rotaria sp. Silwood1]
MLVETLTPATFPTTTTTTITTT